MKYFRPALLAVAFASVPVFFASALQAANPAQSASGALKALSRSRGADYLGRVVMMEGRYGRPQPRAWRVLALDPQMQGRLREFMISGDDIDSERLLLGWKHGRRVPMREVRVDSKDAFLQADLAAKDAKIGFDSLDYQLIMPVESKEPLWVVSLIGKNGAVVGEVQVGAKSGVVLRKAWPQPVARAAAPPASPQKSASRAVAREPKSKTKPPQQARVTQSATAANRPAATTKTSKPQPGPEPVSLTGDAGALKETSGQILEGARRGIIRTTGNVRDFFKHGIQDKQQQ